MNFLLETKWKKLARQGKLSDSSFDRLKDEYPEYLNPGNVMRNKIRGQRKEMEKLGIKPFRAELPPMISDWVAAKAANINNPRMGKALKKSPLFKKFDPKKHNAFLLFPKEGSKGLITNLSPQERLFVKSHEFDELIQGKKLFSNKKFRNAYANFVRRQKRLGKSTKDAMTEFNNIGIDDNNGVNGGHFPGVLKREFELRNLLYPSYRNNKSGFMSQGKNSSLVDVMSASSAKDLGEKLPRNDNEIRISKTPTSKIIKNLISYINSK